MGSKVMMKSTLFIFNMELKIILAVKTRLSESRLSEIILEKNNKYS